MTGLTEAVRFLLEAGTLHETLHEMARAAGEEIGDALLVKTRTAAPNRDELAARAMAGICADPGRTDAANIAVFAYRVADAMLAERAKGGAL